MAEETKKTAIAGIYAQALHELACQRGITDDVRKELWLLDELACKNKELVLFLRSPAIKPKQKIASIKRIFGSAVSELVLDFLCVLANRGRLGLLDEIPRRYVQLDNEYAGRIEGTITTAIKLSKEELTTITEQVERVLNKAVVLDNLVDQSIIGGMVLKVGDKLMDNSVRSNLTRFGNDLRTEFDRPIGFASEFVE